MVFIKKVSRFIEEQLVDIYIVALDSFIPKEKYINMENTDYLAIDMSSPVFDNISQKGKQQILNYFNDKYNIEVINESLDTLKEKGLTSNAGNDVNLIIKNKKGILLGIDDIKIKSKTQVVVEGYWFFTSVASAGMRSTIIFKNENWSLQKTDIISLS